MVAFAKEYAPAESPARSQNRAECFFARAPGRAGHGAPVARFHAAEKSRCRYDARQGVSLAQGRQAIPENALKFQVGDRYRTIRGGDPVSFGGSLGDTFADMGTDLAIALEPLRGPLTITTGVGTAAAGILLTETVGFAWAGVPLTLLGTTQVGLGLSETADYFFGGNAFNTPTGGFELIGKMTGNPTYRTYGSWVDLGVSAGTPPGWSIYVDGANYIIGVGATDGDGNGP